MFTYKNTADQPLTIANVGVVEPGKTITSPTELVHPDLKTVSTPEDDEKSSKKTGDTPSKKDDQSDKEETTQSS